LEELFDNYFRRVDIKTVRKLVFVALVTGTLVIMYRLPANSQSYPGLDQNVLLSDPIYFQTQEDSLKLNGRYLIGFWTDTKFMLTSPFKWKGKDWLKAGIISGSALGLYAVDQDIHKWVQRNRESTSNTISDIFEPLGNSDNLMPWAPVILMYVFGSITDNYRTKKTALLAAESFVISTVYTRILKVTIRRRRPLSNSKKSFPSGHTSSIFAVATVLAHEYRETPWVPTILYTASALSSLSRINDMEHWSSDVFVGFLIGFYTGRTVFNQHNSDKESNLSFLPLFLPDGFGMKINWKLNK